ncbi:MAG: deoxyguanosinetriphosphate triphosphohydrolase [Oscillospiraceae bacterium]|jgi:dGTPase|nr:deoxyguanosinetriphosphate triphosphohydrolase [Oscillospiraceae bacterium]
MTVREHTEEIEERVLSPFAALSKNSRRVKEEDACDLRTNYQQDRDRIVHSKSFRRLKRKTQMFIAPEGDHYRTRLTHTLEVSQIARTISRALRLNEDLTEAIALGHDLGHTPFGHAGESALDEICPSGFKHFEQSLRVVDKLEKEGQGLNLTEEVRDGIVNHTNGDAFTIEGKIVKLADVIAFLNHDIDDAVRAGVLKEEDIPENIVKALGKTKSLRINKLVYSIVENSKDSRLLMNKSVDDAFNELNKFMFKNIYLNINIQTDKRKIPEFITKLYCHFKDFSEKLPDDMFKIVEEDGIDRAVCDYIAGMTDNFAIEIFKELFVPRSKWV